MTWTYSQSSGAISRDGVPVGLGYSGRGEGINNPAMEAVRNTGPIPAGRYSISLSYTHAKKGPASMNLTPVHHDARGRDGFMIHGDNKKMNRTASLGCIILAPAIRRAISASRDTDLEVVP